MSADLPLAFRLRAGSIGVFEINESVSKDISVPVVGTASTDVGVEDVVLRAELEHRQAALLLRGDVAGGRLDPVASRFLVLCDELVPVALCGADTLGVPAEAVRQNSVRGSEHGRSYALLHVVLAGNNGLVVPDPLGRASKLLDEVVLGDVHQQVLRALCHLDLLTNDRVD